jgi:recombinational DNA repair ATPase RecF
MAYDDKSMKYDTFIYSALSAKAVSFDELKELIEKRNEEIREKDAAEERIAQIEKQMKELTEELAKAREILAR